MKSRSRAYGAFKGFGVLPNKPKTSNFYVSGNPAFFASLASLGPRCPACRRNRKFGTAAPTLQISIKTAWKMGNEFQYLQKQVIKSEPPISLLRGSLTQIKGGKSSDNMKPAGKRCRPWLRLRFRLRAKRSIFVFIQVQGTVVKQLHNGGDKMRVSKRFSPNTPRQTISTALVAVRSIAKARPLAHK